MLNQHFIANLVEWIDKGSLIGDPSLREPGDLIYGRATLALTAVMNDGLVPPIYIGIQVGIYSKQTVRTIYRGGGLLSIINNFAKNRVALGPTAGPSLNGLKFEDLDDKTKMAFLSYSVPVCEIQESNGFLIKKALREMDLIREIPD